MKSLKIKKEVFEMSKQWLKQLLIYITKVYNISELIKRAKDSRIKPQIPTKAVFFTVLIGFLFRMKSFNKLSHWLKSKRLNKLIPRKFRLPYIDTIRRSLSGWDMSEQKRIHQAVIEKSRRNKVFRKGTIGGFTVVAFDGVEVFESIHKCCGECLTRVIDGVTHYFHRFVVCMTVGSDPHIIFGAELLHPREDRSEKKEGELTGGKRLLKNLHEQYHHFADIVVTDALYMNKPWIEMVLSCGMDAVIRVKDERLTIVQDALGLFSKRKADMIWTINPCQSKIKRSKNKEKKMTVSVWDEETLEWNGLRLRFLRFIEEIEETTYVGKDGTRRVMHREIWVSSTAGQHVTPQVIWEIAHKRWDIENNGFHELKGSWHIDHCFEHNAVALEAIVYMCILAFNLFQLYIFRCVHDFRKKNITQESVVEDMLFEAVIGAKPMPEIISTA